MRPLWTAFFGDSRAPFTSPIVAADRVCLLGDDALIARRLADGAEAWRAPWPSGYRSGWLLVDAGGALVCELRRGRSRTSTLIAHDHDGACLWQNEVEDLHHDACAAIGSRFYFARSGGRSPRLDFVDAATGTLARASIPEHGRLAAVGGELWLLAEERIHRFDGASWRDGPAVPRAWRVAPHGDGWLVLFQIEGDRYGVGLHDGARFRWEHETTFRGFAVLGDTLVRSLPDAVEACAIASGEPGWRVAMPERQHLAAWGERVLVGLDDKTLVLDPRDGARLAVLPIAIDRAALTPSRLLAAGYEHLSAWPYELEVRGPIDAADLDAAIDAILARPVADDVVPDLVALGLDLLALDARERVIRRALSSGSPHGARVAEEALGDRSAPGPLRAAIEACPSNLYWFQQDLAEAARATSPAALWPALLARTARYAWEANARIVDVPDAALRDPAALTALVEAAATQRRLGAFVERLACALDEGALSVEDLRGAARAIEGALAGYPEGELAEALRAIAARAGLSPRVARRPARRSDRLAPTTREAEDARWERERSSSYHYALFESLGHPVPDYYLPFPGAIALKGLTVPLPDRSPVRHGSWLVALELFAEGVLAVDEALAAAGIARPAPIADPFGLRARRAQETPASRRFEGVATTLGPVLAASWPEGRERVEEVLADLCAPGPQADREQLRAGVWTALALGVAYHHALYRVRVAPFDALVDALEAGGAYRAAKRPSLAALKKAHPALPFWPLHALDEPPASAIESCVARDPGARCPALEPSEVPVDGAGRPLDFVFQLSLAGLRGVPEGFAHGAALVAVFGGARGAVVALDAKTAKARARRAVPPGLVALERGRKHKEPPSAPWLARVDPARFPGRQSVRDAETLLGAYAEATRDAHHTSSKIGGTYTPVQPSATGLPDSGAHHLVAQLDFDDGAPLPDAGLLYVIATEDGGWHVGDEHT